MRTLSLIALLFALGTGSVASASEVTGTLSSDGSTSAPPPVALEAVATSSSSAATDGSGTLSGSVIGGAEEGSGEDGPFSFSRAGADELAAATGFTFASGWQWGAAVAAALVVFGGAFYLYRRRSV
jgi:hypothetical protein